ncbi:OmpA family protein [Photobacterium kagoshimensis]|uniref:MotY family protein n=1 Tax=Photobacterium kagoshimensis TaxID=2910242 RepID=UPI003D0D7DF7
MVCRGIIVALMVIISCAVNARENKWMAALDDSGWDFYGSKTSCVLSHHIRDFGSVKLISEAGEKTRLMIKSTKIKPFNNIVDVESVSPFWASAPDINLYFKTPAQRSRSTDELIINNAENVINELIHGRWVKVILTDERQKNSAVVVQNINLSEPMAEFQQCKNQLIAFNYQQIRDSEFYFDAASSRLNKQDIQTLKGIAEYIRVDADVQKVLVDGHSDQLGQFSSKMRVSRQRAEEVAAMLIELGVPRKLLQIRSHGDRYLVSTESNAQALQLNRRATVRLVRKSGAGS